MPEKPYYQAPSLPIYAPDTKKKDHSWIFFGLVVFSLHALLPWISTALSYKQPQPQKRQKVLVQTVKLTAAPQMISQAEKPAVPPAIQEILPPEPLMPPEESLPPPPPPPPEPEIIPPKEEIKPPVEPEPIPTPKEEPKEIVLPPPPPPPPPEPVAPPPPAPPKKENPPAKPAPKKTVPAKPAPKQEKKPAPVKKPVAPAPKPDPEKAKQAKAAEAEKKKQQELKAQQTLEKKQKEAEAEKKRQEELAKKEAERKRQLELEAEIERKRQEEIAAREKARCQSLLAKAQENLAKNKESRDKDSAAPSLNLQNTSIPTIIGNLQIDSLSIDFKDMANWSAKEVSYSDEVAQILRGALKLPEYGSIKIELTISKTGKVEKVKIVSSESAKNKQYIEQKVSGLHFPSFGNRFQDNSQCTFSVTLNNERSA